ncbi:MAG TPA: phosphoadenylyl-sulfate reductase [Leptospiraceae bacterium]|nr:phosphoadenylyl-sulfate reductase [Leptospiraceae bacterium]
METERRYNIKIEVYFPDAEKTEDMVREKGINLFYASVENRKLCCAVRKLEPLERALNGARLWITGLRREQSVTRTQMNFAEWDEKYQTVKINPLIDWTWEKTLAYIKENKVPYNPLHDQNFPSIGCAPCTRAVLEGENIRAGRWWWENPETKECGLHISDGQIIRNKK